MNLTTLRPAFLVATSHGWTTIDSPADAHGISFDCPCCGTKHRIVCWFADRGTPATIAADRGRWTVSGASAETLTLEPAVHLLGGCAWHGTITRGEVTAA